MKFERLILWVSYSKRSLRKKYGIEFKSDICYHITINKNNKTNTTQLIEEFKARESYLIRFF